MSAEHLASQPSLPEQLISSRVVGHIPAEALAWSDADPAKQIMVSELTFPEGNIYVASAGNKRLDKITSEIQGREKQVNAAGYTALDTYFLRACHLEANGEWTKSDRVQITHGQSSDFAGYQIKDFREAPTPNARRIYYAARPLGQSPVTLTEHVDTTSSPLLLIRLGITDKQHQIKFLHQLTGRNRRNLRNFNVGSI